MGPGDLAAILEGLEPERDPRLLVGLGTADDAGVYLLDENTALIQTVDFFTPIVNDPHLFGQIAAANALSDVYAMGGRPLTALNICCFPIKDLPPAAFREILRGGQAKVHEAGCTLAGGHSVEDPELKYGLAVTGVAHPREITTNAGLMPGQALILTKPLGTGIIATALKAGLASPPAVAGAVAAMTALNAAAARVARQVGARGVTDVTGFGLLGHALEMARASRVGIVIAARSVPILPEARELAGMGLVPLGSFRNRDFCARALALEGEPDPLLLDLLADAQTSGGLLFGVDPSRQGEALELCRAAGLAAARVGEARAENPGRLLVRF